MQVVFSPIDLAQNAELASKQASIWNDKHILERKFDGFRLLAHVRENDVKFYTRTGKPQDGKLPLHEAALLSLFPADTWLDGEIVDLAYELVGGSSSVQNVLGANAAKAASRSAKLTYMVFDCLAYKGLDVRKLPLSGRRKVINQILTPEFYGRDGTNLIQPSIWFDATEENHADFLAAGYEGSIVKRLDAPYASGCRGHGWYKIKLTDEMDCVIMGFKPGENGFAGMIGAIEFGQYKDGVLTPRSRCSGMTLAVRKEMSANQQDYIGKVVSIKFMGIMPSGAPRHPQYSRLRIDKRAEDCDWS